MSLIIRKSPLSVRHIIQMDIYWREMQQLNGNITTYKNKTLGSCMKLINILVVFLLAFLISSCASSIKIAEHDSPPVNSITDQQTLKIQYLGVGGHRLQYGDAVLLTGPSFTNPPLLLTGPFMPLHSNHKKIDKFMPESSDAQLMLIGHAHYDHLLDVAYVMQKHAPNAHLYGSQTTVNSITSEIPAERMTAVNNAMGSSEQPGTWFYSAAGNIRIMALESSHAPHFMGIKLMQGKHKKPLKKLPWHSFGWKEGQTIAYLIDFLDADQQPTYRVFYQDSASANPQGLVPDLNDNKAIDVAIICPASFNQIKNYPESIVHNTQAKHYILGHWEDFFGNKLDGKQKSVRNTNAKKFVERLEQVLPENSHWTRPQLFSTYQFNSEGLLP